MGDENRPAAHQPLIFGALALILVGASLLTLGMPNLALAAEFLGGAYPSLGSALALLSAMFDFALLGAAGVALTGTVRGGGRGRLLSPSLRAAALVLAGAILLGLSVLQRVDAPGTFCCGGGQQQVREAASLAR